MSNLHARTLSKSGYWDLKYKPPVHSCFALTWVATHVARQCPLQQHYPLYKLVRRGAALLLSL